MITLTLAPNVVIKVDPATLPSISDDHVWRIGTRNAFADIVKYDAKTKTVTAIYDAEDARVAGLSNILKDAFAPVGRKDFKAGAEGDKEWRTAQKSAAEKKWAALLAGETGNIGGRKADPIGRVARAIADSHVPRAVTGKDRTKAVRAKLAKAGATYRELATKRIESELAAMKAAKFTKEDMDAFLDNMGMDDED